MLSEKQVKKFNTLLRNWENGQKTDAAKQVKKLTRVEVALILTCKHEADSVFIYWDNNKNYEFERFIVGVLDGFLTFSENEA